MNTNLLENDLKLYIDDTVISVFDTMLAMELRPSINGAFFRTTETQVIGMVGLAGSITALVCLRVSDSFSHHLACAMLGMDINESLSDSDVNDVIGELANITAGKLKSCLRDPIGPCSLSLPTIVRGHTIEMESISGTYRRSYTFRYGTEPIVMEFYSQTREQG
jgi:CheY-specific phosphatase CheX